MNSKELAAGFAAFLSVAVLGAQASAADQKSGDDSLTFHGITLSGIVDLGVAYQTHGAPLNADYHSGLEWVISKNSNKSVTTLGQNGLSQSKLALNGVEPVTQDLSVVFRLETHFSPLSGALVDSSKTLVENAGVPLDRQSTNADGNRQGQLFAGAAYAGLSSKRFGALTGGRQTSSLADAVLAYDPQAASYAFSVLGYQGFLAGAGTTQDVRMEDSVKYRAAYGKIRLAAFYQFRHSGGYSGGAEQGSLGFDHGGFSADVAYSRVRDAISASALSAAQVANPTVPRDSIAATVSDNSAVAVMAKYAVKPVIVFAGYEHIVFENPSHPLLNGFTDDGGYFVSPTATNNNAYPHKKKIDLIWTGVRYAVTPKLGLAGAYYHIAQNSYRGDGCASSAFAQCGGHENAVSLVVDYRFTRRWDVYAGSMYSAVSGGMASGFLNRSTVGTMGGLRFAF